MKPSEEQITAKRRRIGGMALFIASLLPRAAVSFCNLLPSSSSISSCSPSHAIRKDASYIHSSASWIILAPKHRADARQSRISRIIRRRVSPAAAGGDYHQSTTSSSTINENLEDDGLIRSPGIIATRLQKKENAATVWVEFAALAASIPHEVINLGQGFPNWNPPDFVKAAAHSAIDGEFNQYTRTAGHPGLVKLLAERYSRHLHRHIDPMNEVAITVGASQALYISLQSILTPGDEVILLEPFFDLYVGQIRLAGGTPVFVPLKECDRGYDIDTPVIQAAITPKTRAIIFNSPHNPTGKVFTRQEMEGVAALVRNHPRMLVISDEVYKYTVYDEKNEGHVHFASLPDMWDRTLTVSSAGKTFSVTGWQVGWVIGRPELLSDIQTTLPYVQFCASTPMQEALTSVIRRAELPYEGAPTYYHWLACQFRTKRDKLSAALKEAGIVPQESQGGFFLLGDVSHVSVPELFLREGTSAMPVMERDWAFCRWLALEYGVIAIPTSPFYSESSRHRRRKETDDGKERKSLVRFTFCKTDETLEKAASAFRRLGQDQKRGHSALTEEVSVTAAAASAR